MSTHREDTPEDLHRLRDLFVRAVDLPAEQREPFLQQEGGDDPALVEQLLRMLQSTDDTAPPWLDLPSVVEDRVIAALFQRTTGEERDVALAELLLAFPEQRSRMLSLVARLESLVVDMRRRLGVVWELSRGHRRYELLERIGEGGLGAVFVARDHLLGRRIAYKTIHAEKHGARLHEIEPSIVQRFLEEAQIAAQLQHPGIPPVHDLGIGPDGVPFYTMRWIRGRSLAAELEAQGGGWRQPLTDLTRVVLRIAEAVAHAHGRGVLHRDLKPQNVMLGRYGEVCVVDWGLAKAAMVGGPEGGLRVGLCVDGMTGGAGSEGFMAPEQLRGVSSESGDVYSVAAILHVMLTGVRAKVILGGEARVELSPSLAKSDPRLAFVCRRGLEVDPNKRWANMAALRDALAAVLTRRDPAGFRPSWALRIGTAFACIGSGRLLRSLAGRMRVGGERFPGRGILWEEVAGKAEDGLPGLLFTTLRPNDRMRLLRSLSSPGARFQFERPLAQGTTSRWIAVRDRLLGRQVALKEWRFRGRSLGSPCGDARDDEGQWVDEHSASNRAVRLIEEARVQSMVDHPGVLAIHEVVADEEGMPRLVMMTTSLREIALDEGPKRQEWRAPMENLLQVAWALAHAHRVGVIHRQVRPIHILLGKDGDAYLVGWGFAQVLGTETICGSNAETARTPGLLSDLEEVTGETLFGRDPCMAPEIASGPFAKADARSDVWSLGAVMRQCLVGHWPRKPMGEADPQVTAAMIRSANPAIPRRIAEVCVRCLQQDPKQRFPDAEAFSRALQAALA